MRQANKALRALPELARDEAQRTMDVTAFLISHMAAAAAPFKSGNLKASISWASRPKQVAAVVLIHARAFYWKFIEFGTMFLKEGAKPFLRPTVVRLRPDHQARFREGQARALAKMERLGPQNLG